MYRDVIISMYSKSTLITNRFFLVLQKFYMVNRCQSMSIDVTRQSRWALRLVASMQEFSVQPDVISCWIPHMVRTFSHVHHFHARTLR